MSEIDKPKHPGGRPTSYKPEYVRQAKKACELGATDADLADMFDVNVTTIWRWRAANEEFCNALNVCKDLPNERVVRSLYQRACGYSYDAVKISNGVKIPYVEHVPPDTTACIYWLKNRRRDEWRDKYEPGDGNERHEVIIRVEGGLPKQLEHKPVPESDGESNHES